MMTVAPDVFKVKIKNKLKQTPKVFYKKAILKIFSIFTGKDLCGSLFFNKETPTQVFLCEYYKIFKNNYFEKPLQTAASK